MWKTGKQSSVWKTAEPRVMPWCWKFCRIFQSNANCSEWTPILWKIVWSNALKIAQPLKWQMKFCQYHTLLRRNGVISLKIHNRLSERERKSGAASIWKQFNQMYLLTTLYRVDTHTHTIIQTHTQLSFGEWKPSTWAHSMPHTYGIAHVTLSSFFVYLTQLLLHLAHQYGTCIAVHSNRNLKTNLSIVRCFVSDNYTETQ